MSMDVTRLQALVKEAKDQARTLDDRIKRQHQKAQSRRRQEEAKLRRLRQVGLRIVAIARNAMHTLEKWLSEKLPSVDDAEREMMLEEIAEEFGSLHVDNINRMLEPIAKQEAALLKEAKAGVASCDLHSWVCQQNVGKGVAPSVGAILRQRSRYDSMSQTTMDGIEERAAGRSASYKWIARWRSKWRMPKGKIQDRDALPPAELSEKV